MIHPSLKTKITTLFPLATSLLIALLLFAPQKHYWNIAAHYPAQKASTAPVYQQLNLYACITLLLLLFFLAMRYMLVKMTKPLFEEVDEYRGIRGSFVDITHLKESDQARQASNVNERQSKILQPSAELASLISIKEDISDLKIMENQLRHAQKMVAVGRLTGGIAHDFNNILTGIIGYGNILMMKLPAESPFIATVKQILAAAERGAGLTQGLLDFSRKQTSNLTQVDLNDTIERVEKLLHNLIGDNITLVSILAKQPLMVMADSMLMEQVLINLATNARDAMPEGGAITIRTELVDLNADFSSSHSIAPKSRYALLSMSDTGHGMDDNTIKKIFDPYYSIKEAGKETVLGLSIVYGIIKKHNGHIICNSKLDKGTDFCIYLPIKEEFETYPSPDPAALPDQSNGYTILLVGSDKASNTITKGLLEEFGYSVIEAENVGMVLEKYREHHSSIRLVIIDGIITGTNGIKTFREIKATIPIARIVLCGDPQDSTIKQLNSLNRNLHFISKPFSPKELLMNVREVVKDAV
jgi:two-component system, cell cycle sensor histidine kinase and response regulator CckA